MRASRIRLVLVVAGTAALGTLGLAWGTPQERPHLEIVTHQWVEEFGMVSPAAGQTLRLNVVHLGPTFPPNPASPPGVVYPPNPCTLTAVFFDSQGSMVGNPTTRTLEPGKATLFELSFEPSAAGPIVLLPYRASVWVSQQGIRGQYPPSPCRSTLELINTASGLTTLNLLPAVERALP